MSYKSLMVKKVFNVQKRLMNTDIESKSLEDLLPLIFNECLKENIMFYFNFIDNAVVLNLCDIEEENHELRIRCHYESAQFGTDYEDLKRIVLLNAFLITTKQNECNFENFADEDEPVEEEVEVEMEESAIITGDDDVMPKSIRMAIDTLQKKGVPVTVQAIRNHLPLGKMSTSNRMECNRYLKKMEASG